MKPGTATRALVLALFGLLLAASPSAAIDSFFDVFTELPVASPPDVESTPVITVIGHYFTGSFEPTQQEQSTASVRLNGLPPGTPWTAWLVAGPGGVPPSIDSFFDVFCDIDLPVPVSGRVIRDIQVVHPPGTPPGTWRLVPINPGAPPGSIDSFFDVFVDDSFFDITYRVADNAGEHTYHVHGTSPSGRMSFFDVFMELPPTAPYPDGTRDSFFDVFVDFQMVGPQGGLGGPRDLRMSTTATYEGGTTPATHATWGSIKALYK